ncbi:MAG: PAS domain S-box protein [Gallionella sp.]|nr:PAS domain S-box protein [Gallionella sp.]
MSPNLPMEIPSEISKLAFDFAADPIFVLDITGHFIEVNQAACDHTGYSREELLQMHPGDIDDPASRALIPERFAQLKSEGVATFEAVHIHRSGRHIPVEMHIRLFEREGKIYTLNICRDISERKQKELEYQTIVQTTTDGFWIASTRDARFLDANEAYCRMIGYSRDELLSMHIFDVEANESTEETAAHIRAIMESKHDLFETQHRHKQGHLVQIEASVSYSETRGGVFFVFVRDISTRKRYQEELALAASVFNASSASILITDADNRIVSVNPAFTTITGYEPDEVIGRMPSLLSSGKQSQAFYHTMWQSLKRDKHWHGELWNRRKDGQMYAEQLTVNVIVNKDGSVHRYVAIFSDITEKKQAEDLMWRQANYDTVTNLPNRRLFLDRLDQEIKKCRRSTLFLALLFIDLDRFKEINDTYGHDTGDQLLIEAARRLNSCVRSSDTVARLGGDEFTVILAELTETTKIEMVADNILEILEQPFYINEVSMQISGSIGIALYPSDASDANELITKADNAMYAAKRRGRNCCCFYSCNLRK